MREGSITGAPQLSLTTWGPRGLLGDLIIPYSRYTVVNDLLPVRAGQGLWDSKFWDHQPNSASLAHNRGGSGWDNISIQLSVITPLDHTEWIVDGAKSTGTKVYLVDRTLVPLTYLQSTCALPMIRVHVVHTVLTVCGGIGADG
ncbi:hypothetical protein G9A89_000259 [Geosiphon pyriformis]|nr:hypothetical protein G9A89_000259 [Geosiphon pyriformis]